MNMKRKNSSQTTSSKKSLMNSSQPHKREVTVEGHKLVFDQTILCKRSDTVVMTEEEFNKLNEMAKAEVINVQDITPPPFEAAPAPTDDKEASARRQHEWEVAKAEYERKIEAEPKKKQVNLWLPVHHTHKVTMDGQELRLFHTLRGPILGVVLWE